ncbi:MAG TPA: hypothetical protein VGH83_05645 [Candidatus Acidoferrum sp.]|jgi:hypothetical protein
MENFNFLEAMAAVFGKENLHVIDESGVFPALPRFPLGKCSGTHGAIGALEDNHRTPLEFIHRHERGDWGDLSAADKQLNEAAITDGDRILSAYKLADGQKIYIITEWDRLHTTVLLSDEY